MRFYTLLLFIVLLFMPVLTLAKGAAGVVHGLHNLSATGVDPWDPLNPGSSMYATNAEQVCVFCHTPHGGSLDSPLWNRTNPTSTSFTHYNSATLSTELGLSVNRPVSQESLICLSCHDGSISVNHVTNEPNELNGQPIATSFGNVTDTKIEYDIIFNVPGKRIGGSVTTPGSTGDLSDDHPISFSYEDVLGSDPYTTGPKGGTLKSGDIAEGLGVRFFGGPAVRNVECSSCHDPHVNYIDALGGDSTYAPFLIMPNSNSDLCLACHTK